MNPDPALQPDQPVLDMEFTMADLPALRLQVEKCAASLGLCEDRRHGVVLAVHEVAGNALVHGGGQGRLTAFSDGNVLRYQVTDKGPGFKPDIPLNRLPRDCLASGGRGLWLCHQLVDKVEITAGIIGATVTLTVRLSGHESPPGD